MWRALVSTISSFALGRFSFALPVPGVYTLVVPVSISTTQNFQLTCPNTSNTRVWTHVPDAGPVFQFGYR